MKFVNLNANKNITNPGKNSGFVFNEEKSETITKITNLLPYNDSQINQEVLIKNLYNYGFSEVNHSVSLDEIVKNINDGNLEILQIFIDKKIQKIYDLSKSDNKKTSIIQINELTKILNIFGLLLSQSIKINLKTNKINDIVLKNKIIFIEYILKIFDKLSLYINEFKNEIGFGKALNDYLYEYNIFKRNFLIITNGNNSNKRNEIELKSENIQNIIIETCKIIEDITLRKNNSKDYEENSSYKNILLCISIIEKYTIFIQNNIKLSQEEIEELFLALEIIDNIENLDPIMINGYLDIKKFQIKILKEREIILKKLSRKDHLTQAYNREYNDKKLKAIIGSIYRKLENRKNTFFVELEKSFYLLIDIDYFKSINDTYGHLIGDQVLIHLSNLIQLNIRTGDDFCRYGGEEFSIITGEMSPHNITHYVEKIIKLIKDNPFKTTINNEDGTKTEITINITVSIGVSEINNNINLNYILSEDEIMSNIINQADTCLYKIKNNGRNGYLIYNKKN